MNNADLAAFATVLAAREVALEEICCGDSCCHIAVRHGQHTNGGCRCDAQQLKKALRVNQKFAEAVETIAKGSK